MKGLKFGINWIAFNDNPGEGDTAQEISEYVSTLLLADIFEKEPLEIAIKVHKKRLESNLTNQ